VLTASHCVFNSGRSASGYAYSTIVIPGMYPKDPAPSDGVPYEAPYGTAVGAKLFVPSRYIDNESDSWNKVPHDYAVVRVKTSLGAAGTRTFGVLASPLNKTVIVTGYHSDLEKSLRQYTSQDKVRKLFDAGIINHYADTEHGASGSGVTGTGSWADKIFAVHSSGFETYNSAALITDSNYRVIVDWAVRTL
jgi:V8-like Glu-specific endopeptidase